MKTFKIVYIEYNELKSCELESEDIISVLEEFRMGIYLDKDQIISVNQVVWGMISTTEDKIEKPIHAKPSLYSFYFEVIKEIGLKYGYNIVLHGPMNRDLDLVAIPWVEDIGNKDDMVDEVAMVIGGSILMQNRSTDNINGDRFGLKPHRRIVYIININRDFEMKYDGMVTEIKKYSQPQYYIDISVIQ